MQAFVSCSSLHLRSKHVTSQWKKPSTGYHTRQAQPQRVAVFACSRAVSTAEIRRANRKDIDGAARVLSRAFAREPGFVKRTAKSAVGRFLGIRRTLRLVEFISRYEFAYQLYTRVRDNGSSAHSLLVAMDTEKGKIVGCVEVGAVDAKKAMRDGMDRQIQAWSRDDVRCAGEVYMGNLAVMPGWRRRGVGGGLVAAVMDGARDRWDARQLWALVADENFRAKKLYKRLGFSCAAREPPWYSEIGRETRLFLVRNITESAAEQEEDDWNEARIAPGRKMSPIEYLRYCLYDLEVTKKQAEAQK